MDFADRLDMMDDDCDIEGFPIISSVEDQVEKVESYKCKWCEKLHRDEFYASECAFKHAQKRLANIMLEMGYTLWSINYRCGFNWNLKDNQKDITKDNCFTFSHWQCCSKPAYQIVSIEEGGYLRLWGKGGWTGGYGNIIGLDKLPEPYPKEKLFIQE